MSKRSYSDIVDVKTPMSPMFTPFKSSQRRRSTSSYRFRASQLKIFNDPIHQSIKMEGLCLRIIDTVEFQRLHHLKQLGVCDYVFRGATHSRFIHSLGVAHLAEKLICHLRDKQPELNITESDILCVKVAGLCHDLGHGPFSHVFDGVFMRKMHPHGVPDPENTDKLKEWKHEEGSVYMLRHILECNEIFVEDYGLNQDDVIFIEEMILGVAENDRIGRDSSKAYLYDIVNNTRSGLDVDKLDYLARDMRMANVELQSNFDRFIELAFVMPADPIVSRSHISNSSSGLISHFTQHGSGDNMMICYPEKLGGEAIHIFGARYRMHQIVYTHKAVKQIEFMVTDVLEKADEYIRIPGAVTTEHPDGLYKMSECYQDMSAMASLKDSVLDLIDNDRRPELASARAILRRIGMRDLYACVGKTSFERCSIVDSMTEDQILHEILGLSVTISQLGSSAVLHDVLRTPYGRLPFEDHSGRIVTHPSLLSTVVREGNEELGMDDEGSNGGVEVLGGHEESQFNNDDTYYDSMPLSQNSESHLSITTADMKVSLSKDDLIIEKMHIHHGMKERNPVANLRFFPKHTQEKSSRRQRLVARELDETVYRTQLPMVFEDKKVRVFCRQREKVPLARKAFALWCKRVKTHAPFPSSEVENDDLA